MAQGLDAGVMAMVWRFLERHGIATAIAAFLVWTLVEDRRSDAKANLQAQAVTASQLVDLNGQMMRLTASFSDHTLDEKEVVRILLADCINSATDTPARERCIGRR